MEITQKLTKVLLFLSAALGAVRVPCSISSAHSLVGGEEALIERRIGGLETLSWENTY